MLNFEIKSGLDCPYLSEKRKEPFVFAQGDEKSVAKGWLLMF
jgi:hypothetical protein